jgi:hypothetical protein
LVPIRSGRVAQSGRWLLAELLVVALGVLLAFWVEGWRENLRDRAAEADLLAALADEAQQNLDAIESRRLFYQRRAKAQVALLEVVRGAEPPPDSVDRLLREAIRTGTLDLPTGTLSSTLSSGDLQLIQDRAFRSLLTQWPVTMANIRELEGRHDAVVFDGIRPWLRSQGGLPTGIGGRDFPSPAARRDYRDFLRARDFEQLLVEASLYGSLLEGNLVQLDNLARQIMDADRSP